MVVEGAKPCGGDALFPSAGAVDGEKPGGGDTLASFSAAVEGANPGGVCVLAHQQAVGCGIPCSLNVRHQHLWVCPSSAYVKKKKGVFFFGQKSKTKQKRNEI
jgi:hypothetical protein